MELPSSKMSLDVILSIVSEEDLKNLEFCKQLLNRSFKEENDFALKSLFKKISSLFVFSSEEFRREIVEHSYELLRHINLEKFLNLDKESIFGNVLTIYFFVKEISPLTPEKIRTFVKLSELKYIRDALTIELVPTTDSVILDLDERVASLNKPTDIDKCIEILELFFAHQLLARTIDTITGMVNLYSNSSKIELKIKGEIADSLIKKKIDVFLTLVKKVLEQVKDESSLIQCYEKVFNLLSEAGIPLYFDIDKVFFDFDYVYNGNFYFAKILNKQGNIELVLPYDKTSADNIQKVYDLTTSKFVTPKGRVGKLLLHEVFSFRKVEKINGVSKEQTSLVQELRETEIESRIREILRDQNITSHSPVERVDVYTLKLFVNNENDLRDVGMILKGRGYPKVNLQSIASNILNAIDLPIDIVFLVHIGILDDVAREKFINQCNRAKKMYCVIDAEDLAKLFLAYNKL